MRIEYDSDPFRPLEERPKASIVRFEERTPTTHHESEIGCNFDHPVWEYDFPDSRWFDRGELIQLESGEYTDFQSHRADVEGPFEKSIRIFSGRGVLRTEYGDTTLEQFDLVSVPPNTAYQIGNIGLETLWIGAWSSVGGNGVADESALEPASRPGAKEEYDRIMAMRTERGLTSSPGYDGEYDGNPDENRQEPVVTSFQKSKPKTCPESPEVGCNADRLAWISHLRELDWLSDSTVMKLDPGMYASIHTHFDNEGPHEELYWVMKGDARLMTEYKDTTLNRFDCAFFPTGNPHGIGNVGTDTLWIGAWGARGGIEGGFDIANLDVADRPGQLEEYERVMAARKKRGLPLPPGVEVVESSSRRH
jgi:mannose-6-phosphate isomerase-like protein (cupin superfamily)